MLEYKELVDTIKNEILNYDNWSFIENKNNIVFFKKPNLFFKDFLFDNMLFFFNIKQYKVNDIIKNQKFDAFNDYNYQLEKLFKLSNYLPHSLVVYDYSPFILLNNPKNVISRLIEHCNIIEDELKKDFINKNKKELEFDIEYFDILTLLIDDLTDKLTTMNIKFTVKPVMNSSYGLLSKSVLYKTIEIKVLEEFKFIFSVDSTGYFYMYFTYMYNNILSIEKTSIEKIREYIEHGIHIMNNIKRGNK